MPSNFRSLQSHTFPRSLADDDFQVMKIFLVVIPTLITEVDDPMRGIFSAFAYFTSLHF